MKQINIALFVILISAIFIFTSNSQTPQHYNYQNVGSSSNTFPFGQTAGKAVNWLFLANDFTSPTPAPSGNITDVYFFITTGGTRTFQNLIILMAQAVITSLPSPSFYAGPYDTVYNHASVTLTGPSTNWMKVTLDTPYPYDSSKSLIIFVGQCSNTGSGIYVRQNTLSPYRRVWSVGGCPFVASSGDGATLNFGIDIAPPPPPTVQICRNGINVPVPDNNPAGARDTIRLIGNSGCTLTDVNVKLDTFLHTWDSDMRFSLIHGATTVQLINNRGGSGDNFIQTVLNDSAANPISAGTAPFTGSFRPEQPLSGFTGSPSGNWILFMVDQFAGDLGFLRGWCLSLQFTCPTGGVTTIEVPFTYQLKQNYPNPFNPVTTIKYGLPKYGHTSLVIYDVLGREVQTLVDEFKDAGTYSVDFDASSLSSGIYFYTLESGSFRETKKMILVK